MGGGGVGGAEAVDWEETAVGVVGAISDTSVDTALELPLGTGSSDSEAAGSSGERSNIWSLRRHLHMNSMFPDLGLNDNVHDHQLTSLRIKQDPSGAQSLPVATCLQNHNS